MGVLYPVPIDLEDFDAREGWILEIRINRQGVTEIYPLLIQPLLFRILISAFLQSMDITQERSSSGGG